MAKNSETNLQRHNEVVEALNQASQLAEDGHNDHETMLAEEVNRALEKEGEVEEGLGLLGLHLEKRCDDLTNHVETRCNRCVYMNMFMSIYESFLADWVIPAYNIYIYIYIYIFYSPVSIIL